MQAVNNQPNLPTQIHTQNQINTKQTNIIQNPHQKQSKENKQQNKSTKH